MYVTVESFLILLKCCLTFRRFVFPLKEARRTIDKVVLDPFFPPLKICKIPFCPFHFDLKGFVVLKIYHFSLTA